MTLRFLLDTSIISAPVAKVPNTRVLKKLEQHGATCAISSPVWHELIYGCTRLPSGKRREALTDYLHEVVRRSFPVLAYDDAAAAWHGRERARLEALGRTPPFVDGQIAAIAHNEGLTLVTANVDDFRDYDGVDVADWT